MLLQDKVFSCIFFSSSCVWCQSTTPNRRLIRNRWIFKVLPKGRAACSWCQWILFGDSFMCLADMQLFADTKSKTYCFDDNKNIKRNFHFKSHTENWPIEVEWIGDNCSVTMKRRQKRNISIYYASPNNEKFRSFINGPTNIENISMGIPSYNIILIIKSFRSHFSKIDHCAVHVIKLISTLI